MIESEINSSWWRAISARNTGLITAKALLSADVTGIAVIKDFVLPVHFPACPALRLNYLPVVIYTTCRSSFQNP
jgi:hypothetical protein